MNFKILPKVYYLRKSQIFRTDIFQDAASQTLQFFSKNLL